MIQEVREKKGYLTCDKGVRVCFFPVSLFPIQNNSSLNNFIYNGQNRTRCEKKFIFFKKAWGKRGRNLLEKKKIPYRDVYKSQVYVFAVLCPVDIWKRGKVLSPPQTGIYGAPQALHRLDVDETHCQQQAPKQDGQKSQENNQDRKIYHHQLLNKKLAHIHTPSHRLNRNFPS